MARKNENIDPINLEGELWISVPGYELLFEASSLGRIKSIKGKRIIGAIRKTSGYVVVSHLQNGKLVNTYGHRIIALAWTRNPNKKPFVNHINGIKHDNRPENLEWVTHSENRSHSFRIGLENHKGERHPQSKLTEQQILDIRSKRKHGQGIRSIGREYAHICSLRNVRNILNGTKWAHI